MWSRRRSRVSVAFVERERAIGPAALLAPRRETDRRAGAAADCVFAVNADNRIEWFARRGDTIWHSWQVAFTDASDWHGAVQLGTEGGFAGRPTAARGRDGRLVVAARKQPAPGSADGEVWWTVQDPSAATDWAAWASLGGAVAAGPVLRPNADGHLELFAVTDDGTLVHRWEDGSPGRWAPWDSLGGSLRRWANIAYFGNRRMCVYGPAADGSLSRRSQTAPSGGWEPGWTSFGMPDAGPGPWMSAAGVLELFTVAPDGTAFHAWEPNFAWQSFGGSCRGGLDVALNRDGRRELFADFTDGTIRHIWQRSARLGWSGWAQLGSQTWPGPPTAASNDDGHLEVFARDANGAIWHNWQIPPSWFWQTWRWSGWRTLDLPPQSSGFGADADDPIVFRVGRVLNVFLVLPGAEIWHDFQRTPNNGWSGWISAS